MQIYNNFTINKKTPTFVRVLGRPMPSHYWPVIVSYAASLTGSGSCLSSTLRVML